MIVAICSSKGAPGVTSAALTLAAVWPRSVVLVEADPSGGDLAFRCRSHGGGPLATAPNLLGLAAAARNGRPAILSDYAQLLASGVAVIQGVSSPTQGRGVAGLWAPIAKAFGEVDVDVIADLGRLDRAAQTSPIVAAADRVLVAFTASLESIVHTREAMSELGGMLGPDPHTSRLIPLIIGAPRHAQSDRDDVDQVMAAAGVPAAAATHLPLDHLALVRLESGENVDGRLSRTLLIRAARTLADQLAESTTERASA